MTLRPDYQVPTRDAVKNCILTRWKAEKNRVRLVLKKKLSGKRCGITTDMRNLAAERGCMVTTLYYIDEDC